MSRLEEVKKSIRWAISNAPGCQDCTERVDVLETVIRTLAAEVDELQRRLEQVVKMLEPLEVGICPDCGGSGDFLSTPCRQKELYQLGVVTKSPAKRVPGTRICVGVVLLHSQTHPSTPAPSPSRRDGTMDRWEQHSFFKTEVWEVGNPLKSGFVCRTGSEEQAAKVVAACDTYEAKIAELAEERSRLISQLARCGTELARAKRNGEAQDKLDRIAALVKPVPVAELVEAGTEAPALLAERHRQIRAILEDEG